MILFPGDAFRSTWGEQGPNVQWTFAAARTPGKDAGLGSPSTEGQTSFPDTPPGRQGPLKLGSSLIGNEPTTLLAPCPASAKDSGATARIAQSFP